MPSLYELDDQLKTIEAILAANEDPETEEILENAKIALEQDIENKMESILKYKANCDGDVAVIKTEIARLQKKAESLSKKSEFLKNICFDYLNVSGKAKANFGTWTISKAKKPASVVLSDDAEALLPDCYWNITKTPAKAKIKDAMTDGELYVQVGDKKIVLATLEQGETVRIK